jgi:four helix bundle suffix protein
VIPWDHCGRSGYLRQRGQADHASTKSTLFTKTYPEFSANAALVLLAVACALLDRQVERLAQDFENEGGFTERRYKVRSEKRRNRPMVASKASGQNMRGANHEETSQPSHGTIESIFSPNGVKSSLFSHRWGGDVIPGAGSPLP